MPSLVWSVGLVEVDIKIRFFVEQMYGKKTMEQKHTSDAEKNL